MKTIALSVSDVLSAGSISAAIEAYAAESDTISSGIVGPSFATSGPGSGWQKNYSASDFAARALSDEHGASYYIDSSDGRIAELKAGEVAWSEGSVVELTAPDDEEIADLGRHVRMMIEALDSGHCIEGSGDWAEVRALAKVSEAEACKRYDIEIVGDGIVYYDDNTRRWYVHDLSDLRALRLLMGDADDEVARSAYSHWCAQTNSQGEYGTQDEAREAAKSL